MTRNPAQSYGAFRETPNPLFLPVPSAGTNSSTRDFRERCRSGEAARYKMRAASTESAEQPAHGCRRSARHIQVRALLARSRRIAYMLRQLRCESSIATTQGVNPRALLALAPQRVGTRNARSEAHRELDEATDAQGHEQTARSERA